MWNDCSDSGFGIPRVQLTREGGVGLVGGQFDWKNIGLFPDLRDLIYTFWFIYCVMAFLSYTYLVQGMWGLEFRVWGLGFMVWVEGFRVWGLGFMVWDLGLGV